MQGGPGVFRGGVWFYRVEGDLREETRRIDARKCPLHLLTGEYDFACTPDDSRRTAAAIEGVEVTVMDGLGHYPMSEQVPPLPPAGGGRARLTPGGDRGHS